MHLALRDSPDGKMCDNAEIVHAPSEGKVKIRVCLVIDRSDGSVR